MDYKTLLLKAILAVRYGEGKDIVDYATDWPEREMFTDDELAELKRLSAEANEDDYAKHSSSAN